jgi:hypothetical protein
MHGGAGVLSHKVILWGIGMYRPHNPFVVELPKRGPAKNGRRIEWQACRCCNLISRGDGSILASG